MNHYIKGETIADSIKRVEVILNTQELTNEERETLTIWLNNARWNLQRWNLQR